MRLNVLISPSWKQKTKISWKSSRKRYSFLWSPRDSPDPYIVESITCKFEESMSLERSDVEKIAHLARLSVSNDELDAVASDLSNILNLVEQMDQADTEGVEPMAHPLHMVQRLREDRVTEQDQRELFQSIAPLTEDGLYLVPRVIE